MHVTDPTLERRRLTIGWASASALLATNAALTAMLAFEHIETLGRICGQADVSHCIWCAAATGFTASALAAAVHTVSRRRSIQPKR